MLTKEKIKAVHDDIRDALEKVAKKHGLTVSDSTKIRYNDTTFRLTAEFGDAKGTAGADPRLFNNAQKHAWKVGLDSSKLGTKLEWTGLGTVTWVGMTGPAKAVIKTEAGKQFVVRAEALARVLK